jgi:hypothetical protein
VVPAHIAARAPELPDAGLGVRSLVNTIAPYIEDMIEARERRRQ